MSGNNRSLGSLGSYQLVTQLIVIAGVFVELQDEHVKEMIPP